MRVLPPPLRPRRGQGRVRQSSASFSWRKSDNGFTDVRFLRDWRRVRGLDPEADIELLESYEAELRRLLQSRLPEIINYRGPMSRRDWLLGANAAIVLRRARNHAHDCGPHRVAAGRTRQAGADVLWNRSRSRASAAQSGRRVIYHAMRDAFEKAGVWQIHAERYCGRKVHPERRSAEDRLRISPQRGDSSFPCLSLATDVDSAKVLAFSYTEMRRALHEAEHAISDSDCHHRGRTRSSRRRRRFRPGDVAGQPTSLIARLGDLPQIAERAAHSTLETLAAADLTTGYSVLAIR